jgi:hypothetical protein
MPMLIAVVSIMVEEMRSIAKVDLTEHMVEAVEHSITHTVQRVLSMVALQILVPQTILLLADVQVDIVYLIPLLILELLMEISV